MLAEATAETYEDVRLMIYKVCWKFQRKYGGEFEEWRGMASLHFMRAYNTFNSSTKFSSWCQLIVYRLLQEDVRVAARKRARVPIQYVSEVLASAASGYGTGFAELMCDLSEDARMVARIAVEAPPDVRIAILQQGGRVTAPKIRKAIREMLRDLGWSVGRITTAFTELKEALK